MITIGDVQIFVTDFNIAMRFWADGLGLEIVEEQIGESVSLAVLEFPDGGPAMRICAGSDAWGEDERPDPGSKPTVRFDMLTDEFDDTVVRLLDHGGRQLGEIESDDEFRIVTISDPDGNSFDLIEVPLDVDDSTGTDPATS